MVNGFDLDAYNSIGERLLRRRAITPVDLVNALEAQAKDVAKKLGEVLVEMGACSQDVVDDELRAQEGAARTPDKGKSAELDDALAALDAEIGQTEKSVRRHSQVMFAAVTHIQVSKREKPKNDLKSPDTGEFRFG